MQHAGGISVCLTPQPEAAKETYIQQLLKRKHEGGNSIPLDCRSAIGSNIFFDIPSKGGEGHVRAWRSMGRKQKQLVAGGTPRCQCAPMDVTGYSRNLKYLILYLREALWCAACFKGKNLL